MGRLLHPKGLPFGRLPSTKHSLLAIDNTRAVFSNFCNTPLPRKTRVVPDRPWGHFSVRQYFNFLDLINAPASSPMGMDRPLPVSREPSAGFMLQMKMMAAHQRHPASLGPLRTAKSMPQRGKRTQETRECRPSSKFRAQSQCGEVDCVATASRLRSPSCSVSCADLQNATQPLGRRLR